MFKWLLRVNPLLMLATIGLCLVVAPASATFSGRDGRVLVNRGPALYTMNPDGTAMRELTHPPTGQADADAQWSPDGTRVVFVRGPLNGNNQIYTIRADGTGLTQLTTCTGSDPQCVSNDTPTWTPDGKTIVFSHCCVAGNGGTLVGLYTMLSDGSAVRQITLNPDVNWGDFGPTVSPDGKWVAFTRAIGATPGNANQSVSALFLVGIDGSGLHQVPNVPYSLMVDEKTWSPDGSRIVFTSHAGSNSGPFRADLFSVAPRRQRPHTTHAHDARDELGLLCHLGPLRPPDHVRPLHEQRRCRPRHHAAGWNTLGTGYTQCRRGAELGERALAVPGAGCAGTTATSC